jgi:cytochrome c2
MTPSSGAVRRAGRRFSFSAALRSIAPLALSVSLAACQGGAQQQQAQTPVAQPAAMNPIEHGKHLVSTMVCNDCHTPWKVGPNGPEPDMSLMLSGHPQALVMPPPPKFPEGPWVWAGSGTMTAFAGPWGVSFSANLTPDTTTGIGAWDEETFIETLRNGRHMGSGRPLLPPMPWSWYGMLTDDELKAMFAYLQSIPPIANQVPAPIIAAGPPGGAGEGK